MRKENIDEIRLIESSYINGSYNIRIELSENETPHRFVLHFISADDERILPVPASDNALIYEYSYPIKDLFLYAKKDDQIKVTLYNASFLIQDKIDFEDSFAMPKAVTPLSSTAKRLRRILGACALPYYTIHGLINKDNIEKLAPEARIHTGKKRLVYHVNASLRAFSGTGLSKRDRKLFLLEREYFKAVKNSNPHTILMLSERGGPLGDNFTELYPKLAEVAPVVTRIPLKQVQNMTRSEIVDYAKDLAEAKLVVINEFLPELAEWPLRSETKLVQTWHACGAFKQFGYSRLGKKGGLFTNSKSHRTYDYAYVSSELIVPLYAEAFGISPKKVLPLGVPRTDIFYNAGYSDSVKKQLKEKYPVLNEGRPFVVLFAPTFRGDGIADAHYPINDIDFNKMLEVLPRNSCILIKNHPFVKDKLNTTNERIIEVNDEAINDLLYMADVLITDYSSVIFEASLLNIPMIFYAYDLAEYMHGRDVYFEYTDFIPGRLAKTESEMLEILQNRDFDTSKTELFADAFFTKKDGLSTDRVANHIIKLFSEN